VNPDNFHDCVTPWLEKNHDHHEKKSIPDPDPCRCMFISAAKKETVSDSALSKRQLLIQQLIVQSFESVCG